MADKYYGAGLGAQQPTDVLEQASTTSRVVEVRINDTVYNSKLQVLMALEAIENYLKTVETNPIG